MTDVTRPASTTSGSSKESPPAVGSPRRVDWALLAVTAGAVILGCVAYAQFLGHPRQLWDRGPHDRNYHYLTGVNFGLGMREANIPYLLQTVDKQRTWGLLHGVVVGVIMAIAGPDFRLGVLPSLLGWVGTAILGFLVARRMVQRGGNVAGLSTALFILASPAHQAFATDIMLESSGALLSMWVLHRYLVLVQEPSVRACRLLGLALTLLFLLKTNYWILVFMGLVGAELWQRTGFYLSWGRQLLGAIPWKRWLGRQLRHPVNYILALLLAAIAWIMRTGGGEFHFLGRSFSTTTPHNLLNVAYAIVFFRAVLWWRKTGKALLQSPPPAPPSQGGETISPASPSSPRWEVTGSPLPVSPPWEGVGGPPVSPPREGRESHPVSPPLGRGGQGGYAGAVAFISRGDLFAFPQAAGVFLVVCQPGQRGQ